MRRQRSPLVLIPLLFVSGLIAWADRVNISVAAPKIMEEFGWDVATMGVVLSAFGWGYLLTQLGTGWLSDRWGGLKTLTTAMIGWSAATLLTALPRTPLLMALARGIVGVCESAYGPAQAAVVTTSFPPHQIGRVLSVCVSATALGPLLAVPLATYVLATYGWRMVFICFGAVGFLWAGVILLYARGLRDKDGVPSVTSPSARDSARRIPLTTLLRLAPVWGLGLAYLPNTYTYYFVANWMPTYLIKARGFSVLESGFYAALPFLCAFLLEGSVGWVSYGLESLGWSRHRARKSILSVGSAGAGLMLVVAGLTTSPLAAVVGISLATGLVAGNIAALWILATDMAPGQVGTVTGFMSLVGSLGALLAPMVTGFLVKATGRWEYALFLTSAINALCLLIVATLISAQPLTRPMSSEPTGVLGEAPTVAEGDSSRM